MVCVVDVCSFFKYLFFVGLVCVVVLYFLMMLMRVGCFLLFVVGGGCVWCWLRWSFSFCC